MDELFVAGGESGGHGLRASLYEVALLVGNRAASVDFYEQAFGYRFRDDGNAVTGIGPGRRLLLVAGSDERKGLSHAGFAVADEAQLAGLRARLDAAGVAYHAVAGITGYRGEPIAFDDPDGNRMIFGIAAPDGIEPSPDALPARLQHVVFASTGIEAMLSFYRDVIGFGLSDCVTNEEGLLTTFFAHCSQDHHSVAVFRAGEARLDHHCFEAGDWGLIRDWGDHFARLRIPIQWGPGRHGPGDNLFIFVHDPDGYWLEISAELEMLEPGRRVGVWPHEERTLNSWGAAFLRK